MKIFKKIYNILIDILVWIVGIIVCIIISPYIAYELIKYINVNEKNPY